MCNRNRQLAVVVCVIEIIIVALSVVAVAEGEGLFLGTVENGRFRLLAPAEEPRLEVGLTSVSMQEAVPPESGQLALELFEGAVIVVRGFDGGGWIYSAGVIEVATPLLGEFILNLFPPDPCVICLQRLNSATREDFEEIPQIGPSRSEDIIAARPFVLDECRGASDIERLLDAIPGIGEVLRERIARHFCPELYDE